jgi:hypothetical protein
VVIKCPYCEVYLQACCDKMALFCPTCKRELSREAMDSKDFRMNAANHDQDWLRAMNVRWK